MCMYTRGSGMYGQASKEDGKRGSQRGRAYRAQDILRPQVDFTRNGAHSSRGSLA